MAVHYGVETGEVRQAAEAAGVLHGAELEHFRRFGDRMMPDGTRITNVPPEIVEAGVSPTHTNPLVKAHPETGRKALWVSPRFVHHLARGHPPGKGLGLRIIQHLPPDRRQRAPGTGVSRGRG